MLTPGAQPSSSALFSEQICIIIIFVQPVNGRDLLVMPPRTGQLNKRGVARREQILDEATKLFAEQGYRGSGLLALAERVGVSHTAILRYFGTKENLLRAVLERRNQIIRDLWNSVRAEGTKGLAQIETPFEPELLTRLATVLRAENLNPGDPLHDDFVTGYKQVRANVALLFREAQERGEIRVDLDPDDIATQTQVFAVGIETLWLLAPNEIDRSHVESLFRRMLGTYLQPRGVS
jgi:AcrR family transcriptional regulator